jgi:hypothetical protein
MIVEQGCIFRERSEKFDKENRNLSIKLF